MGLEIFCIAKYKSMCTAKFFSGPKLIFVSSLEI